MRPAVLPLTGADRAPAAARGRAAAGRRVDAVLSTWLFVDSYGVCGERGAPTGGPTTRRPRRPCGAAPPIAWPPATAGSPSPPTSSSRSARPWSRTCARGGVEAAYLPNGCDAAFYAGVDDAPNLADVDLPAPIAGFVGHINSRTDLALLEAVAAAGASLLLIGPRDPAFEPERFEALVARPNVPHLGPRPSSSCCPT